MAIPKYMVPTVRNSQLPTAQLAKLLDVSPAEVAAVRARGPYCGEKKA